MEEYYHFDPTEESPKTSFKIETGNKKITLNCTFYERWSNILRLQMVCGGQSEKSFSKIVGVKKVDKNSLEEFFKGSLGNKIFGMISAGVKEVRGTETSWEHKEEDSFTYACKAPEYGKRILFLYQKQRVYNLDYEDCRWLHKDHFNFMFHENLDVMHDDSKQIPFYSPCSPPQKAIEDYDGLAILKGDNFSLQCGYNLIPDQEFLVDIFGKKLRVDPLYQNNLELMSSFGVLAKSILLPEYITYWGNIKDEYVKLDLIPLRPQYMGLNQIPIRSSELELLPGELLAGVNQSPDEKMRFLSSSKNNDILEIKTKDSSQVNQLRDVVQSNDSFFNLNNSHKKQSEDD